MHHLYVLNYKQSFIYSNKLHMCFRFNKKWNIYILIQKGIKIEVWQLVIISAIIWYVIP
jgi:hypothetical protein